MKNNISLGKCGSKEININLEVLLKTRLLIQANSGGGKSWLLRRLAEQMFGKIPVIIIDPEGEFATLREKFGYVLVGKGGETPADLRSASMVAHKLLELRASAVCDLYEMKPQARHQWVRMFLDALIDAPKELWRPTVIIVDEAHQYAPEGKAGESEASSAMVDLATRGRKRGFCAIFATQRLGKLRKDAAAELLNVMVGMTFIDIDRERAAECLGVSREEKHKFNDEIKLLTEGNFYCLGRAITKERLLVKVGGVETTHPEAGGGKFAAAPPPAPEVVKAMMPKLADLPKAAEEKAKTEAELRSEIRTMKLQLTMAKKEQPKTQALVETKTIAALTDDERKWLTRLIDAYERVEAWQKKETVEKMLRDVYPAILSLKAGLESKNFSRRPILPTKIDARQASSDRPLAERTAALPRFARESNQNPIRFSSDPNADTSLGKCERSILAALAQYHPHGRTAVQVALLAEYSVNSGGFNNSLGKLRSLGYITRSNPIQITEEGRANAGSYKELPTGLDLAGHWIQKLAKCEATILQFLTNNYPQSFTSQQVGEAVGYSPTSGGFNNALGRLRTLELITRGQPMKASKEFFQ